MHREERPGASRTRDVGLAAAQTPVSPLAAVPGPRDASWCDEPTLTSRSPRREPRDAHEEPDMTVLATSARSSTVVSAFVVPVVREIVPPRVFAVASAR